MTCLVKLPTILDNNLDKPENFLHSEQERTIFAKKQKKKGYYTKLIRLKRQLGSHISLKIEVWVPIELRPFYRLDTML